MKRLIASFWGCCPLYYKCQVYGQTCREAGSASEYCGILKKEVERQTRVKRIHQLRDLISICRTDKP